MGLTYNWGHGRAAFATRVRCLRQHPEIWKAVPNGLSVRGFYDRPAERQLWSEVVDFLRGYGLVADTTFAVDVNVPKLIAAVRELEAA